MRFVPQALVILTLCSIIFSCRKDDTITTSTSAKLNFSADTVIFDTVFTTLGSVTQKVMVYNNNSQKINISSIRLGKGVNSMYRINVDGTSGFEVNNVEIAAHDSMYIFVKVTINPNNQSNPLIINDSIVFITNSNLQNIQLVAWGQDAYYHVPNHKLTFNDGTYIKYSIADCSVPWPNDKPHVIYGYCVVDSASTLTLQSGTKLYFAPNAVLWVYSYATLKVYGSSNSPVSFQGARLDAYYKDLPGQWGKIWLSAGSKDNEINFAVIKNGTIGIQADTNVNSNPTLTLNNTMIDNMSVAGLYAQGAKIYTTSSVISNCGSYGIVLSIGGDYQFYQCTLGNYWNYTFRQTPSLVLNNYYKDNNNVVILRPLTRATFGNCIIYGSSDDEILLDSYTTGTFNFKFDNCILKTTLPTSNPAFFNNCKINTDPLFKNTSSAPADMSIPNNSPAIGAGSPNWSNLAINGDYKGNPWGSPPSIGAFEKGSKK